MKPPMGKAEKILIVSISLTLIMLIARGLRAHSTAYLFFPWNLLLAVIPLYFSRKLSKYQTVTWKSLLILAGWLLFFPNAPYIITDIFHFYQRPGVPVWYDLLLVLSAAWNGLIAGFISLMQVDNFISRHTGKKMNIAIISFFVFAASSGIYLGRFLRFNSWDVVRKPRTLAGLAFDYVGHPTEHISAWVFSLLCTALLLLIYYSIKNLPAQVMSRQAD